MNDQTLEEKTQIYWGVGMLFHQGIGCEIPTSQAIHLCGDTAELLGPQRALRSKLLNLQDRIILGRGRKKKAPPTANLLQFKRTAI